MSFYNIYMSLLQQILFRKYFMPKLFSSEVILLVFSERRESNKIHIAVALLLALKKLSDVAIILFVGLVGILQVSGKYAYPEQFRIFFSGTVPIQFEHVFRVW